MVAFLKNREWSSVHSIYMLTLKPPLEVAETRVITELAACTGGWMSLKITFPELGISDL
jgi:hypothetical protein